MVAPNELLTADEVGELRACGRIRRLPRGATLFQEGDKSETVAYVTHGRVKVSTFTDDGAEVVLALAGPGQLLGELSAIDNQPRSANVTALEPVEVIVVLADAFRRFTETHPRFMGALLHMLAARLRDSDRKRVEFGAYDTTGRVAHRLLEMADRFGSDNGNGVDITLALTQDELAGWVGASREAVSKALRVLRERGLVETGRRRVHVCDVEALRRWAR